MRSTCSYAKITCSALVAGSLASLQAHAITVTKYPLGGNDYGCASAGVGNVGSLMLGSDGKLWFGMWGSNVLGNFDPISLLAQYRCVPGVSESVQGEPLSFQMTINTPFFGGITEDQQSRFWVSGKSLGADDVVLGRSTTDGSADNFVISESPATPNDFGIAADTLGNVWLVEAGSGLVRIASDGSTTNFPTGSIAAPNQLILGPDNRIWMTDDSSPLIGQVNPSNGFISVATLPTTDSTAPEYLTPDTQSMWYMRLVNGSAVFGNLTTALAATEYPAPVGTDIGLGILSTLETGPITVTADHRVALASNYVISIPNTSPQQFQYLQALTLFDPSTNSFTSTLLDSAHLAANAMVTDSDGNLWISDGQNNSLDEVTNLDNNALVSVSVGLINFGSVSSGTTTSSFSSTLTHTPGDGDLTIGAISNAAFARTDSCGSTLSSATANCTVAVAYTASTVSPTTATLTVSDSTGLAVANISFTANVVEGTTGGDSGDPPPASSSSGGGAWDGLSLAFLSAMFGMRRFRGPRWKRYIGNRQIQQ